MIATHQPERQLNLMFSDEPQLPEAVLNECGVMVANTLQRTYMGSRSTMGFKDTVQIVVGHHGGIWAAGRSLRIDTEYTGSAPSFKWGKYDSMSDAIDACIDWAVIALRRKIASDIRDRKGNYSEPNAKLIAAAPEMALLIREAVNKGIFQGAMHMDAISILSRLTIFHGGEHDTSS